MALKIPSNIHYYTGIEQGSYEWFKLRDKLVTGSTLFSLLSGRFQPNNSQEFTSYWTERGKALEPQSINVYEQIMTCKVESYSFIVNDNYPNAGYSPDGINTTHNVLIESKSFKGEKHLNILTIDDIPPEVIAQIQLGLLITELEFCDLLLFNPDVDTNFAFKVLRIPVNKKIRANIIKKLEEKRLRDEK